MTNLTQHKQALEKLVKLIERQKGIAVVIDPKNEVWRRDLDLQAEKAGDNFTVMIVGAFSSGKSTLINAIIGEDLLPSGLLPETGVLTEFHYGEKKSITAYPKKDGRIPPDPVVITPHTPEAISSICSIDNKKLLDGDADDATNCYEKLIITWPLDILKDGVVLIDTVGLGDPWGNDFITKDRLPSADAVIYLINGSSGGFDADDQKALEEINSMQIRDIIFGVTRFDEVVKGYRNNMSRVEQFKDATMSHCAKYSKLSSRAVFFLDSCGALQSKLDKDRTALIRSGLPDFESYISSYLVNDKGTAQISGIANTMRGKANQMKNAVDSMAHVANLKGEAFEAKIKELNERLALAEKEKELASKQFRAQLELIIPKLNEMVDEYLKALPNEINLDGFKPETRLPTGTEALNPVLSRRKAKALSNELFVELQRRTKINLNTWVSNKALPFINESAKNAALSVQHSFESFNESIDVIGSNMAGKKVTSGASASQLVMTTLTGGWGPAVLVGIYGKEVAGRVMAANLASVAAVVVLSIIEAPLTLPAVILGTIIANILALIGGPTERRTAAAMKSALKDYRKSFAEYIDQVPMEKPGRFQKAVPVGPCLREQVKQNLSDMVMKISDRMDDALNEDYEQARHSIALLIEENRADSAEQARKAAERAKAARELDDIIAQVDAIAAEYGA